MTVVFSLCLRVWAFGTTINTFDMSYKLVLSEHNQTLQLHKAAELNVDSQ